MLNAVVDNDILLKTCLYRLDAELTGLLHQTGLHAAVLPVARYVVRSRLRRIWASAATDSCAALERIVSRLAAAEPSPDELSLAASFESAAQRQNLELDGGESQLLAMVLIRGLRLLLTGDKRAIRAIEQLADSRIPTGFIGCFEQLILTLLRRVGAAYLREHVCREPAVDRAISACFACHSSEADTASVIEGVRSFIEDLRTSAGRVLVADDDLSGFVA
jgi:hypothetical protein